MGTSSLAISAVRAGVPFFFKQWGGENKKRAGRLLDGRTWDEMPDAHRAARASVPANREDVRADLFRRPEDRDLPLASERQQPADRARVDEAAVDEDGLAEGDALLDLVAGAARLAGLDEDHGASEPGHDAVAGGEVPAGGGVPDSNGETTRWSRAISS